jgi:hypothetical protein
MPNDKKQGVYIRQHKNWNTKTIYNNGRVMRIYRHQPKTILFSSPMVSDFNQNLCGGWTMPERNSYIDTYQQMFKMEKPFAVLHYDAEDRSLAAEMQELVEEAGMLATVQKVIAPWCQGGYRWDILACQDMTVGEIGDFDDLVFDYIDTGLSDISTMRQYSDMHLSEFFEKGWDIPEIPLWLTGLILGYPVENTISLYWEHELKSILDIAE